MGVKVKCKECGNKLERSDAYLVESISEKTLKINKKYYCDEKCYKKQETRKELIIKCNDLMEEILDIPIRSNIYFNKMYSPIIKRYDYDVIYEFLTSEKDYIEQQMEDKDFNTVNVKLKYFLAIMQNNIGKYEDMLKQNKFTQSDVVVKVSETDSLFDDFIPTESSGKKVSFNDILNEL